MARLLTLWEEELSTLKSILFFLLFAASTVHAQDGSTYNKKEDDALIEYFSELKLESFEGSPADSFLRSLKHSYNSFRTELSRNHLYRGVLIFTYNYGIEVHIYLNEFRYANPFGMCRKRNRRLAGKEIISTIQIHNGIACIQGCT